MRLGTVTLTPQLVDLLAKKLPDLNKLELLVRDVIAPDEDLICGFKGVEWGVENQIVHFYLF